MYCAAGRQGALGQLTARWAVLRVVARIAAPKYLARHGHEREQHQPIDINYR